MQTKLIILNTQTKSTSLDMDTPVLFCKMKHHLLTRQSNAIVKSLLRMKVQHSSSVINTCPGGCLGLETGGRETFSCLIECVFYPELF